VDFPFRSKLHLSVGSFIDFGLQFGDPIKRAPRSWRAFLLNTKVSKMCSKSLY
jgi:hypothetical protein